jgi:hypothetical protein
LYTFRVYYFPDALLHDSISIDLEPLPGEPLTKRTREEELRILGGKLCGTFMVRYDDPRARVADVLTLVSDGSGREHTRVTVYSAAMYRVNAAGETVLVMELDVTDCKMSQVL